MKKEFWLTLLLDYKDALCNLEAGLLEDVLVEDLERYVRRVELRWAVLKKRILTNERDKLSS